MTDHCTPATPSNNEAVLAALLSTLQITPAQHDQIGRILSRIQPAAAPTPAPSPAPALAPRTPVASPTTCTNVVESSREVVTRLWNASCFTPPHCSPTPPDLPPLIPDPNPPHIRMPAAPPPVPAAPLPPPNPPYSPLPENAVVVPEGYDYHIPHPTKRGPYYLIVRRLNIGVYARWEDAAALIIGVSGSVYCKVPSIHVGCVRLDAAMAGHGATWLP
ncbi:uncharacterized protein ARMOST_19924 [Armillaria ostoyae]|uniref:Uncharacterized protein n=1 Tax=Armillaria ostoyae TaxID=47428 RepID=A0A284S5Y1_ARMOS|nr:uncharacterized protein ARMOST_19924 [Armillaria ostoyae]